MVTGVTGLPMMRLRQRLPGSYMDLEDMHLVQRRELGELLYYPMLIALIGLRTSHIGIKHEDGLRLICARYGLASARRSRRVVYRVLPGGGSRCEGGTGGL